MAMTAGCQSGSGRVESPLLTIHHSLPEDPMTPPAYDPANIFGKILRGELPSHRVYEDDATIAIMDVMPTAHGHTLVIPKAPSRNIFDADPAVLARVIATTQKLANAVKSAFN